METLRVDNNELSLGFFHASKDLDVVQYHGAAH